MRTRVFQKNALRTLLSGAAPIMFTLAVVLMITMGLRQTEEASRAEGARFLEEAILRAAVHCYAIEGSYPENLAYITENYGIHIDRRKYVVFYEIFASNILPDITVITLNN
jgi:hypothetical protein